MSVSGTSVNGLKQVFREFNTDNSKDSNGNVTLDRQEIAKAAVELHNRGDEVSLTQASILATMVIPRGEHEQGLFPDFNGDNVVSTAELEDLADETGAANAFESDDFGAKFPNRGPQAEYTVSDLEAIANEAPANASETGNEPGGEGTPGGTEPAGADFSGFGEFFSDLLERVFSRFFK